MTSLPVPRRRRNGQAGRRIDPERLAPAHNFEVIVDIAVVRQQRGNGLGRIQRTAAADADHKVRLGRARRHRAPLHYVHGWLGSDREGHLLDVACVQPIQQRTGALDVGSRHDEGAHAQRGRDVAGLGDHAVAEEDAVGRGKFKGHKRFLDSSGLGTQKI